MEREIITTKDGSKTIYIPEWHESYHSRHGAIQESNHVFIQNGLKQIPKKNISILEMGFGTGLNALLTLQESIQENLEINYTAVEAYPVSMQLINELNYCEHLTHDLAIQFTAMHRCPWDETFEIHENFSLTKKKCIFQKFHTKQKFDLIYFDVFGFRVQPELWSENIFLSMFNILNPNGLLVTYACRSIISKNMQSAGFQTKKLPGAPGKREMTLALK